MCVVVSRSLIQSVLGLPSIQIELGTLGTQGVAFVATSCWLHFGGDEGG